MLEEKQNQKTVDEKPIKILEEWPSLAYGTRLESERTKVPWVRILPLPPV